MATISASPRVVAGSLRGSLLFTPDRPAAQQSPSAAFTPDISAPDVATRPPETMPWRLFAAALAVFALTIALSGVLARAAGQVSAMSAPVTGTHIVAETAAYPAWTVAPGDTLWSIASATAPGADPRATVEVLRTLNGLGADHVLQVGEVLQVPTL